MIRRIFYLLVLLPYTGISQPFLDLAHVSYQYSPSQDNSGNNPVETNHFFAGLTLPFRADSDYIVLSPSFEKFEAEVGVSEPFTFREKFQVVSFPVTWQHQWNSNWKTGFIFIPKASGNWADGFSGDLMQYGGAIINTWKRHSSLKYKFGVYYNQEFFGPFVLPLLGIDWNISPRLNLFGVLPGSMNLEFKNGKRVHTGIAFRSITTSYRTQPGQFLRVYDNHLRLFMDIYLLKSQVLSFEAGHSVLRKYRSGERNKGDPTYFNLDIPDGFLLKASYSFRKRTD